MYFVFTPQTFLLIILSFFNCRYTKINKKHTANNAKHYVIKKLGNPTKENNHRQEDVGNRPECSIEAQTKSHLLKDKNKLRCDFLSRFILWADIDESKLVDGTEVVNSTFTHNKKGCQMTFDDDYSAYWVYFINFLGTLAVLPGNIVSALLMDKIGRLSMLGKNGGSCWRVHLVVIGFHVDCRTIHNAGIHH